MIVTAQACRPRRRKADLPFRRRLDRGELAAPKIVDRYTRTRRRAPSRWTLAEAPAGRRILKAVRLLPQLAHGLDAAALQISDRVGEDGDGAKVEIVVPEASARWTSRRAG